MHSQGFDLGSSTEYLDLAARWLQRLQGATQRFGLARKPSVPGDVHMDDSKWLAAFLPWFKHYPTQAFYCRRHPR